MTATRQISQLVKRDFVNYIANLRHQIFLKMLRMRGNDSGQWQTREKF